MKIAIIAVSLLLFTSACFAEWTPKKDTALLELLQERQRVFESSAQAAKDFGYDSNDDLIVVKLLSYLTKDQKQDLLNKLVDDKTTYNNKKITEAETVTTESTDQNTALETLKE